MIRLLLFSSLLFFALPQAAALAGGLPDALVATLENHPAIKGKLAELAAQGYNIEAAKAGRLPTLSAELSRQDDGDRYAYLNVQQPLWAFGKIEGPIARERSRFAAETLSLLQLQRQLLGQTAVAYEQIQGVRLRLLVADENIAELDNLYRRVERRQVGQLATEADVRIAFSRLTQAQAQREQLVGALQVAENELWALTQSELESEAPVSAELAALPQDSLVLEQALEISAEIRNKKLLIEVAKHNVAYERVAATPTLYLEAQRYLLDYSTTDKTTVSLTLEGDLDGLGWSAFNRSKAASSQVDAARHDWRSTYNGVQLQVKSLLSNYRLQVRLEQALQVSVDAVRATRESYLRQYDSGRKSWLEVLNIQRELTEQRLQLAQAQSDRLVIALSLAALIGQLDATAGLRSPTDEEF
jgi:adhesin transport system outer membrane protein